MKDKQLRILNVIGSLETGGAESLLYYIHRHLKEKGYENFTICTFTSNGSFYEKAKHDGLQLISLGLKSKHDPRAIWRLVKVIKKGQFNVIHTHLLIAYLYSVIALFFVWNVKLVYTIHGIAPNDFNSISKKFFYKILSFRTDRVVAVSNATMKKYIELTSVNESKVSVVWNAVKNSISEIQKSSEEKRRELDIEHNIPILLAIGRVCEAKDYETLLKAAKLLKDQDQRYRLLIAGDGPLWDEMNLLRDTFGLQNNVTFLGRRNDIAELLNMADIFVQSSRWEGLSISIIEAMMFGKPIVATAVDGTCEQIRNGIDGLLVPAGDHISLANAIKSLLNNKQMQLQYGQSAKKRAYEEFTMNIMSERLIKLYEEVFSIDSR